MADITDPFRNEGQFEIVQSNGYMPPLERITPEQHTRAQRMGKVLSALIVDVARGRPESTIAPPHPSIVALDLLVVCLSRPGYSLERMEDAPADVALAEYVKIATHINRPAAGFPPHVELMFDTARH